MSLRDRAAQLRELADELDALADEQGEPCAEESKLPHQAVLACVYLYQNGPVPGAVLGMDFDGDTVENLRLAGLVFTKSQRGVSGGMVHLTDKGLELAKNNNY